MRIPVATYRLQFNSSFKFTDAIRIIPYLHELGITDVYSSPYFSARKGSPHGYEVGDPNSLNQEVGTEEEYFEFVRELRRYGMGQILDIVPNHLCITCSSNSWWTDVLENGVSSTYSSFFDIDWAPVKRSLENKVLLPILGDQYGTVLENQELTLAFKDGSFSVSYQDQTLPVMPDTYVSILSHRIDRLEVLLGAENPHYIEYLSIITALTHLPGYLEIDRAKVEERYREKEIIKKRISSVCSENSGVMGFIEQNVRIFNGVKGSHRSFDLLDDLLNSQVWRLSHWRVATEEINYRRFFDVNSLAALKMEDPVVFREAHRLIFRLISEGAVDGLRIDHVDGLYDPIEYFRRLQGNCSALINAPRPEEPASPAATALSSEGHAEYSEETRMPEAALNAFYIIGEKILSKGERVPDAWPISGTTGYVFLNLVNGIFVEAGNVKIFDEIYGRFIGSRINFTETVYEKKRLVMQVSMSGEINSLAQKLSAISEESRHTRDFTLNSLTKAITEIIACFPVYRTYINSWEIDDRDRQYVESAVSKARRRNPAISSYIFDFLKDVLLLNHREEYESSEKHEWLNFVMRFQQITGPVMAKGMEDTAFYVFNRLASLNEVGGSPERFGTSLEAFHGQNIERIRSWPHALLATSTHDTKRSEDVRARINALSEMPQKWRECLARWSRYNRRKKEIIYGQPVPDRNEEYLLYQTLIGIWPLTGVDENEKDLLMDRVRQYMLKASREAKVNTSWINRNLAYEGALMRFVDAIISSAPDSRFIRDFKDFQKIVSLCGMYNSLSQTLLKIASPGVPDFYQGTEIWDFSLVDPDNRRDVDYGIRTDMLDRVNRLTSQNEPMASCRKLLAEWESGGIKLFVISRALAYRRENHLLFRSGDYLPLESRGARSEHVCAFARLGADRAVLVVVPRLVAGLLQPEGRLLSGRDVWGDTEIVIPDEIPAERFTNVMTRDDIAVVKPAGARVLYLADMLDSLPVAMLEGGKDLPG